MGKTAWDVYSSIRKYDGSPTAHKDVVDTIKKHGHHAKMSDAWCTEAVMAMLYDAGAIDCIGGYSQISGDAKRKAKAKGIFHEGSSGILPFDHVIYGDKNGKPNHSEIAIGKDLNVSGNYNKACSRRKRSGRRIIGYTRPKYSACADFDNLQITILAAETILGTFGGGDERVKNLSVFGKKNAEKVQAEVERVWHSTDLTVFDLAVYVIADFAGKDSYRRKRLGSWSDSVQKKINEINALRGKSTQQAVQYVLENRFGSNAVRRFLLDWCGYDAQKVQDGVNDALRAPQKPTGASGSIVSLFRDAPREKESVDGLQGDCIIVKQGKAALIMDVMRAGALDKITAEISGMTTVQLYISHPHSDHMGSNANWLVKNKKVSRVYLPAEDTIHSDYKSRYKALVNDCKKTGVEVVVLRQGDTFRCGEITGKVLYQQADPKTDSVNMRSLCTLITVAGRKFLTCGDHHCGTKESSFKYDGHVDVYKSAHHQLYTGDKKEFIRTISPDWIIGSGWKSWPLGSVSSDPKVRGAQNVYQGVGNLLPGDVCGRTELVIGTDGSITAKAEKNMSGHTIKYRLGDKIYQKVVHTCIKTKYRTVASMLPVGARLV